MGSPGCTDRLGNEMLQSCATERELRVLVNGRFNVSALAARGDIRVLGHSRPSTAGWAREGIALICTGAASPQVLGTLWGTTIQ